MRTLRFSVRLLCLAPLVAAGCSSVNGARPPHVPKLRTITSIGDRPTSIIAGAQGEEATASDDLAAAQLSPDGKISGRVVDDGGHPLPHAEVRVALGGAGAGRIVRTRTDDAGGFTLHGLKPGSSYTLVAESSDDQAPLVGRQTAQAGDRRVRIALRDPNQPETADRPGRISPVSETALPEGPGEEISAESVGVNEEDLPPPADEIRTSARREGLEDGHPDVTTKRAKWRRGGESGDDADDGALLASGTREIDPARDNAAEDIEDVNPLPPARLPSEALRRRPVGIGDEEDPLPPALEPERLPRRSTRPNTEVEPEGPSGSTRRPDPRPDLPDAEADPLPPARMPARRSSRPIARPEPDEENPLPPARELTEAPAPRAATRKADPSPSPSDRAPAERPEPQAPEVEETDPLPPAREPNPEPAAPAPTPAPVEAEPTPTAPESAPMPPAQEPAPPSVEEPPIPAESPASAAEATPAPEIPAEPPSPSVPKVEPPSIPDLPPDEADASAPESPTAETAAVEPKRKAEPESPPAVEPSPGPLASNPAVAEPPPSREPPDEASVVEPPPAEAKPAEAPRSAAPAEKPAADQAEPAPPPGQSPMGESGPPTAEVGPTSRPKRRPTWGEVDSRLPPPVLALASRRPAPPAPAESSSSPSTSPTPTPEAARREPGGVASGRAETYSRASCQFDARRQQLLDFRLPDLQGRPVRFKDMSADLVLIDFWGTWCAPCVESIPHLIELQRRFGPERLKIVGIAYEQASSEGVAPEVESVAQRLGVNYAVLLGEADGRPCPLRKALNVEGFPTMVLIDRQGRILWRDTGADAKVLSRLDSVIASNLALGGALRR